MTYACMRSFHYILLKIKLEQGVVTVLDSRRKDPQDYADMTQMLEKYVKSIIIHHISNFVHFLIYQVIVFFVWQGLEKIHHKSSGTAEEAAI